MPRFELPVYVAPLPAPSVLRNILTQLSPNGTAVPSSLVITQLSLGLNTELTQAIRRLLGLAGSPEDRKCDKHSQEPAVTHLVSSEVAY